MIERKSFRVDASRPFQKPSLSDAQSCHNKGWGSTLDDDPFKILPKAYWHARSGDGQAVSENFALNYDQDSAGWNNFGGALLHRFLGVVLFCVVEKLAFHVF